MLFLSNNLVHGKNIVIDFNILGYILNYTITLSNNYQKL